MLENLLDLLIVMLSPIEADRMEYHVMQSQTQVGTKGLRIGLIVRRAMGITLTLVIVMDIAVDIATHNQTAIHISLMTLHRIHIAIILRICLAVSAHQIHQIVTRTSLILNISISMSQ